MMRRVTFAANQGQMGGGEVMLFAMATAARDLGWEVSVVAPQTPGDVVTQAQRLGFHVVAIHGTSTRVYLRNLRRWDATQRKGWLWCNGLRPAFATSGHRHRVVHLHQRPEGKLKPLAALAVRGVEHVIVPSRSMQQALPDARILWNWSARVTSARPAAAEPITVGFLGRLSRDKGMVTLCEAMQILDQRSPGRYRLVVAGESRFVEPHEAAEIETALRGLGELVDHRGWVSRDEFFADVQLAVFPSVWEESFGLVVTEAMSACCPFVISDAGALPEVAGPDHPWVFSAGDAQSLADQIENAAEDLGRGVVRGFARWSAHFSPEAGRERLADILDDLSPPPSGFPRVALAHDYLTQRGGAERVVLSLLDAFPGAELVTSVYDPEGTYPELRDADITTSVLNRSRFLRKHFRVGLPLYGLAFERSRPRGEADVVVASTTGYAHGVACDVPKVVYCHSPARFLYLVDDYLGKPWYSTPVGWVLMALRPALIGWDQRAAHSADVYLCNSTVVRDRIKRVYGIDAQVVHPPCGIDPAGDQSPIPEAQEWSDFHLVVSRLMPYKNVDVVIDAFRQMPERRLLVIGRGPLRDRLRAGLPHNVAMVEGISDAQMRWAYAHATAVIAPSQEDFGLSPVEGFSFGTPALALRAGGYLDTVVEGVSGYFFDDASPAAIAAAVHDLAAHPIDTASVRGHAVQFAPATFASAMRRIVAQVAEGGSPR